MPLHAPHNLYPGINAHLNSLLQQPDGGWQSFHGAHIEHLQEAIEALLPPNYYADSEQSLQISSASFELWTEKRIKPDITIYQTEQASSYTATLPAAASAPTLELPLWEIVADEEDYLKSVVIYRVEGDSALETPVTRIELISPANKPPHSYHRQYLASRLDTLRAGIALVEIDYIHQRRPVLPALPPYSTDDPLSYPYMVLTSNPRKPEGSGSFQLYGIGALAPLPNVTIPLLNDEVIVLDLGQVYNRTYDSRRRYRLRVDYANDPPDFDFYRPDDRAAIRALLETLRAS